MQVYLFDNQTQKPVAATLVPIMWNPLNEARNAWIDEFLKRQDQGLQDDDISVWSRGVLSKATCLSETLPHGSVLDCQGQLHGIVIFETALQPSCRTPGSHVLYVNYLAPAPWNRRNKQGLGRFKCVGRQLVAQAIRESLSAGCPGRIGLHSLPCGIEFYSQIGFDKFDTEDSRPGMTYFEMGPKAALALLADSGPQADLVAPSRWSSSMPGIGLPEPQGDSRDRNAIDYPRSNRLTNGQ